MIKSIITLIHLTFQLIFLKLVEYKSFIQQFMKITLSLIFLCSISLLSFAQQNQVKKYKGTVVDSVKNNPLPFATVILLNSQTKQPVKSLLTKDDGSFEFTVSDTLSYTLQFANVGYQNKIIDLTNGSTEIVYVKLSPSTKLLSEVVITAAKSTITKEVDRISYNVQNDPENKILTVLDMLRKVPMVQVDGSDNIKLKGTGNFRILINGKQSALVAKNPSDIFKAMPASNILKIEVITIPPAKYEAEGLSGIINIITKKNIDQGYNGSVNTRYNNIQGGGINLNATIKQKKFGLGEYIGLQEQGNVTTEFGNSNQIVNPSKSSLLQLGKRTVNNNNLYSSVDLSFEIDSLNLLTGNFQQYNYINNEYNNQFTTELNGDNSLAHFFNLANDIHKKNVGYDFGLDYQLGFKEKKEKLLTASYKYNYSANTQNADAKFLENTNINSPNAAVPNFRQFNNAGTKEHTFQLDYVWPLEYISFEAGAKAISRNNYSDFKNFNQGLSSNDYSLDSLLGNSLNYFQNVYGAYNSYQLKFKKWVAKAGIRLEITTINANFNAADMQFNQAYKNLVPSISVQRKQNDFNSYTFGYTQRIQRPGIWQLNPFIDRQNPKFVNVGNPNLMPVTSNTFELAYSNFKKGSLNIGLNYGFANNTIENVLSVGSDTITTATFANVGTNKSWGLDVTANYPFTEKLTFNVNAQLLNVNLSGTFAGVSYKNQGFQGHIFIDANYKFEKGFKASTNFGYDSRYVLLQGRDNDFLFYNFSGSKEMLKQKATLSLGINNPFLKFRILSFYNNSQNFMQRNFDQMYAQNFKISFNYKFGKLNGTVKKNERGISNDDVNRGRNSSIRGL